MTFPRLLRALAAALDLETDLLHLSAPEALERLYELCDKEEIAARVDSYAKGALVGLKAELQHRHLRLANADLKAEVEAFLFHNLVAAMAFRYTTNVPVIHHWMPLTYLARFGKRKASRGCIVQTLNFSKDTKGYGGSVSDKHFAHDRGSDGRGFYHLAMEQFFSRIEAISADALNGRNAATRTEEDAYGLVVHASFFAVQAVRNPHPSTRAFSVRSITGVVDALQDQVNNFDAMFLTIADNTPLGFTPYVPTRTRRLTDGTAVRFYPLSPTASMLIADRPLDEAETDRTIAGSRRAVIAHARRNGGVVYGVTLKQIRAASD